MKTVKQTKIIHKIAQTNIIGNPWKAIELFNIKSYKTEVPLTPDIQNWLTEYFNEDIWPNMMPRQPKTGYNKLDILIVFFGVIQKIQLINIKNIMTIIQERKRPFRLYMLKLMIGSGNLKQIVGLVH